MSQKEFSERQLKVAENLKRIMSNLFNVEKLYIPVIGDIYITVSEVRMSPDLKLARIYILPSCAKDDVDQVIKLINEFSHIAKKSVAKSAKLKYVPKLHFVFDDLFDEAQKIEDLIGGIRQEDGHD